ncbi:hypothetical protein ACFVUS_24655 [Nocardia sp. NPDC058058]|uniref:hypothetical protein n=1 Tax=Nocardia sp. NPDC058058 TaxID=3346317 RepID=UPI0036DD742B
MAVGTGAYDGGYSYDGELLIFELWSGRSTSVLRWPREILRVEWAGERAVRLLLAPNSDFPDGEYDEKAYRTAFSAVVERPDWTAVAADSVDNDELGGVRIDFSRPATELLTDQAASALAGLTGRRFESHLHVWDVQLLPDGRVLACADGVLAESWLPDGQLEWRIPDEEGGRQIAVRDGQLDAWVNAERRVRWIHDERGAAEPILVRISLADGKQLDTLPLESSVVFTTREDGWLALRPTEHERKADWVALIEPSAHSPEIRFPLGSFDLFNHPFPIRRSSRLLFLQGNDNAAPWQDKRVVSIDPTDCDDERSVRELFPLEWDSERAGHLFGGPGIEIDSPGNKDLVHAGAVHNGAGLLPGNAFVVRRNGADGAARWVFTADFPVTALDGDENTIYAAFNSGELVAIRTSDGTVRWRQHLEVDRQGVVPLSLTLAAPGRLLIGTVDGRILDCAVE